MRMSANERYSVVHAAKLRKVCLKKGHWLKQCTAAKCTKYQFALHVLLHLPPMKSEQLETTRRTYLKKQHYSPAEVQCTSCFGDWNYIGQRC